MAIGRFTRDLKGPAQTPELSFEEAMFVPMQRKAEKDKITDALFAIDTGVLATEQDKAGILNDITNNYNAQIENIANTISGNNANLYDARKQVLALNKDVAQAKNTGIYYQATKYYNEREEAKKNFFDPRSGQDIELLNSKWNEWELAAKEQGLDGAYNPNTGELITAHNFPRPPVSQDHTSHLLNVAKSAGLDMEELAGVGFNVEYKTTLDPQGRPVDVPIITYDKGTTVTTNEKKLDYFVDLITREYSTAGNAFGEDWKFKGNKIKDIFNLANDVARLVSTRKEQQNKQVSLGAASDALKTSGTTKTTETTGGLPRGNVSTTIPITTVPKDNIANLNKTLGQNVTKDTFDPNSMVDIFGRTFSLIFGDDAQEFQIQPRVIADLTDDNKYKLKDGSVITQEEYEELNKFADPKLIVKNQELGFITKFNPNKFEAAVQDFIDSRNSDLFKQQLTDAYSGNSDVYTKEEVEGLALQSILRDKTKWLPFVEEYEREREAGYVMQSINIFARTGDIDNVRLMAQKDAAELNLLYGGDRDNKKAGIGELYPLSNPSATETSARKLFEEKGYDNLTLNIIGTVDEGNPSQVAEGWVVAAIDEEGNQEYYVMPRGGMMNNLRGAKSIRGKFIHDITKGALRVVANETTIPVEGTKGTIDNLHIVTTQQPGDGWKVEAFIKTSTGVESEKIEFTTSNASEILSRVDQQISGFAMDEEGNTSSGVKKKTNVEAPLVENTSNDNDSRNINLTTIDREGTLTQEDLIAQLEPWEEEVRNRGGGVAVLTKSFGNLRPNSSNPYQDGIYQTNGAGAYQTFDSYDSGLKGLIWDVKAKQFKDGLTSRVVNKNANVLEALKIWAPAKDKNNPNIYAKNVLDFINSSLGTNYTTNSLFSDLPTSELVEAIIKQEDIQLYSTLKSDGFFKDRINLYADNIKSGNIV